MSKLTDSQVLSIIANELSNSDITTNTSPSLQQPLEYYLGRPNGTEVEGRSQLVSTDVADAVEWILPQIMKSFTQNNEVVTFDPLGPEDELQAEIESEYVYDVLMKQNNGFTLIHEMVKDALIQRNGLLKVYYDDSTQIKTYSYSGISEQALNVILSAKNAEIVSAEQNPLTMLYDVEIAVTNPTGKVVVDCVAPENFRVNSQHDSIFLDSARFSAHIVNKTISELMEEGYSESDLEGLMSADLLRSSYRFNYQDESTLIPSWSSDDESQKLIEIAECYLRMDYDGKGIAQLYKVTVAGMEPPTKVLKVEPLDSCPWISGTAILMSHKFKGLSIFDRLKQIQDNKIALIRNIMDNLYLQNNQRNIVLDGQVNLDDMMVSRPGGLIRVKRLDAIQSLVTPMIGEAGFTMLNYLDEIRAGRTGVSSDGSASPQNIGDRVGSQGVDRLMNAKEELVGLMIRVICETAIKPLCLKIRDLVTMHTDSIQNFKFKGQWIQVNPSEWGERSKCTVRVGTGSGDVSGRLAAVEKIMQAQGLIQAVPGQTLVNPIKAYAALDEFCKLSGLHSANKFFVDPNSPEGQQAAQQAGQSSQEEKQKNEQVQIETLRAQAELAKSATTTAEAQAKAVEYKGQAELAKQQREMDKLNYEARIGELQTQLDAAKTSADSDAKVGELEYKYRKMLIDAGLKLTEIEANTGTEQSDNFEENMNEVSGDD
jgi:hypothetical protein